MKKFIALTVVAILTIALCISASAKHSFDRLYLNENTLSAGNGIAATQVDEETGIVYYDVEMQPGDMLYMLGWVVDAVGTENMTEVYYKIDGAAKTCADNYRDRGDVAEAFKLDVARGTHAGVGQDDNAFAFTGLDQLGDGTYLMEVFAKFTDGSEEQLAEINLVVGTGVKPEQPATEGTIRDFAKDKGDAMSYDAIFVNDEMVAEQNDPVIAYKKLVDGSDGHITSVGMYGWYGNSSAKIVSYGYMIDDNAPVFGDFKYEPTEDAVIKAGGEFRYKITADVTGLKDGKDHKIQAVAKLDNGEIVKLNRYEGEKDRDAYVNYRAQLVEDQNPPTPVTGDATVALISIVAVISLAAVVVFRKRVF